MVLIQKSTIFPIDRCKNMADIKEYNGYICGGSGIIINSAIVMMIFHPLQQVHRCIFQLNTWRNKHF